jgi:hypothetical protein
MTEKERKYIYAKEWKQKNKFEFKLISGRIYNNQRAKSKERGHPMPTYTLEELRSWMLEQDNLNKLLKDYRDSGGEKELSVSIDRDNDDLGYSFDNIKLGTWKENDDKERMRKRKPVIQMTLEGEFVKEWTSTREAARETGIHQSNISFACNGIYKKTGGFKWKFAN